jgi:hypothetical protein
MPTAIIIVNIAHKYGTGYNGITGAMGLETSIALLIFNSY